jgi:hypothetical protein
MFYLFYLYLKSDIIGMRPKDYPPGKSPPVVGSPLLTTSVKGPPTLPLIGNLHQVPMTDIYKQLQKWAQKCEYK